MPDGRMSPTVSKPNAVPSANGTTAWTAYMVDAFQRRVLFVDVLQFCALYIACRSDRNRTGECSGREISVAPDPAEILVPQPPNKQFLQAVIYVKH